MSRDSRQTSPKLFARGRQRRATREVAALPKGSKGKLEITGKRNISLSPSQPHSKSFGR
jgi:hypothetical protein